jgi:hypothetical protein
VVVVAPHQADHLAHVLIASDSARRRSLPAGEDRVVLDPSFFEELVPLALLKEEVR